MARQKLYQTPAQRQLAYRVRLKERLAGLIPPSKPTRKTTRPQRLQSLKGDLELLAQEYQHWLDSMPDNLAESSLASQLEETIETLENILDELQKLQLPRGFGR